MKRSKEPKDWGTPEISRQFAVVPKLSGGPNGGLTGKVVDETEIDRLLLKDKITSEEHGLLNDFLRKLMKSSFIGYKSPSYDVRLSTDPSVIGDRKANDVRRIVWLMEALDETIKPRCRAALVNLVLMDAPWPYSDESLKASILALNDILGARQRKFKRA